MTAAVVTTTVEAEVPGPGELYRLLGRFEKAMDAGFESVNDRLDNFRKEFVPRELYESERDAMREDIENVTHGSRIRWQTGAAVLAAAGSVVAAVVAVASHIH